ncbi:MAG: AAA family ATPase [Bacteroidota bacterium]
MSTYIKKYIITGAPGTGKTTLVNALAENYPCVHEVSRKVIVNEQEKGRTGTPWQDMNRFAELVYKASIVELEANPQALFIDRSILDLTAYLQVEAKPIPLSISSFPYHDRFHRKVFFAPTWRSIYQKDEQRLQSFEHCLELERVLKVRYIESGFDIVILPKDTVPIRVNFVHEFLKSGISL